MEAITIHHSEIDPDTWDRFVLSSPQGMIYAMYDYISLIEPDWYAIMIKSNETIHAAMPFIIRKKIGVKYSMQPAFAHYWGVMFRKIEAHVSKAFELKKQCLKQIIDQIPESVRLFSYNFSPAFDYPLPFYWNGFKTNIRYTYQIDLKRSLDEIWSNIAEHNRRDIRKAQKNGITIKISDEVDTVINIFRKTKGNDVQNVSDIDYGHLSAIVKHFFKKGMSYNLIALNNKGEAIAGIVYFKFNKTTIYYFGSTEPEYKTSGAMSLIIWDGIQRAVPDSDTFDFEGSMIEPVERFFRGFGSVPVPYLNISRDTMPFFIGQLRKIKLLLER